MSVKKIMLRTLLGLAAALLLGAACLVLYCWLGIVKARAVQRDDRQASSPPSGGYVAAGDARLFVQQEGDPDAPAVVFIHGTGSWSETWRASMMAAARLGYHAVAIDLPPFGYSIPPASDDYAKPRQAQRLLAALDSLGIKQAVFVAHSFGAAPVVEALLAAPGKASALVLVDGALGLDAPQTDGGDSALQSVLRIKPVGQAISAAVLTNPARTQALLRSFISEKDRATYEWVRLYQRPLSLDGSYRHVAAWLPELVSRRGRAASDDPAAYRQLTMPVTLIWGATDTITPLSQAEHLRALLPDATLITIPKAGHIPQIEEPEMFLISLTKALEKK